MEGARMLWGQRQKRPSTSRFQSPSEISNYQDRNHKIGTPPLLMMCRPWP